jgi:hypothetical protein
MYIDNDAHFGKNAARPNKKKRPKALFLGLIKHWFA